MYFVLTIFSCLFDMQNLYGPFITYKYILGRIYRRKIMYILNLSNYLTN